MTTLDDITLPVRDPDGNRFVDSANPNNLAFYGSSLDNFEGLDDWSVLSGKLEDRGPFRSAKNAGRVVLAEHLIQISVSTRDIFGSVWAVGHRYALPNLWGGGRFHPGLK